MKSPPFLHPLLIGLVAAALFPACRKHGQFGAMHQIAVLDSSWQYRYGDSPRDSAGVPRWAIDRDTTGWRTTSSLHVPPGNEQNSDILWARQSLPEADWENAVVYLPGVILLFDVYLDSTRIFNNGDFDKVSENAALGANWYFVPLPAGFGGKQLSFRIKGPSPAHIGVMDSEDKVQVGVQYDILRRLFHRTIDGVMLGFFFVFLGLSAILLFFRRFKRRPYFALSFGALALSVGVFYIVQDKTSNLLIESAVVRYYLQLTSVTVFPIFLYLFIERIIGVDCRGAMRRLWQAHVLVAAACFAGDFFGVTPLGISAQYYMQFFLITILIGLYESVRSAIRGNSEVKLLLAGFMTFGIFGLNDILLGQGVITDSRFLSHWGALIFFSFLGYIIERRFAADQERLAAYSRDLETISENLKESKAKLEEYSHGLEEKVKERTRDIELKNDTLQETLEQLTETQNQLVLKEKMASLGNLVAGVAHEVNNPIGAVCSAADVSRRCLEKIKGCLKTSPSLEDLHASDTFQKSLRLLEENTKVTNMATERVSRIVRSLKDFARLDEAELQKADIHDGIDSTLTLIQHELKNRISVEREYGQLPLVQCFPNQLNQVFMNILVNAAQAIEGEGVIKIRTTAENGSAGIEIEDTGKGISSDKIDKIFDPGFTTKGVGIGTGLGLSISYNIVEKHNGEISVNSEVGKGTVFRIRLPVTQNQVDAGQ